MWTEYQDGKSIAIAIRHLWRNSPSISKRYLLEEENQPIHLQILARKARPLVKLLSALLVSSIMEYRMRNQPPMTPQSRKRYYVIAEGYTSVVNPALLDRESRLSVAVTIVWLPWVDPSNRDTDCGCHVLDHHDLLLVHHHG